MVDMNMTRTRSFSAVYHLTFHRKKQNKQTPNIYVSARMDQWIKARTVPREKQ